MVPFIEKKCWTEKQVCASGVVGLVWDSVFQLEFGMISERMGSDPGGWSLCQEAEVSSQPPFTLCCH